MSTSVGHALTITGEPDKLQALRAALYAPDPDQVTRTLLEYAPKISVEGARLTVVFHARNHDCVGLVEALAERHPQVTITLDLHYDHSCLEYQTTMMRGTEVLKPWTTVYAIDVELALTGPQAALAQLEHDLTSETAALPVVGDAIARDRNPLNARDTKDTHRPTLESSRGCPAAVLLVCAILKSSKIVWVVFRKLYQVVVLRFIAAGLCGMGSGHVQKATAQRRLQAQG